LVVAVFTVFISVGILYALLKDSLLFFKHVSPWAFLTGTQWYPLFEPRSFGVLPLFLGTMKIGLASTLLGFPMGFLMAIYLTEYAPRWLNQTLRPILEVLAGIPTIVYGYFALFVITPFLQLWIEDLEIFNALSASLVVAVLIVPIGASMCTDAIASVPQSLRSAGYALGMQKLQVILYCALPAAKSGIFAALLLSFSRVIGETMAVAIAAGATPSMNLSYFQGLQTMTAYIVQVSLGDTPYGTVEYHSLFAVGLMLFLTTFVFNFFSLRFIHKRTYGGGSL
jgi:phosphate transport system permease protein